MDFYDFEAELVPHAPALLRLARRLWHHEAEDLVQETFMRAFAARHRYTPGTNGRAWLMRILCNLAVSERRRARVVAHTPEPAPVEPRDVDDEMLVHALEALGPSERRVLELADIQELSYREIARALGCPIGTVMSRLHRARRRLRRAALAQTALPPAAAAAPPAPAHRERTENRRAVA